MVYIPLIYFIGLFAYIYLKQRSWGVDLAATFLLITISFFAIMIDIRDIYGDYGVNEYAMTLPTVLLFCFQWTMVIALLHYVTRLPLNGEISVKKKVIYIFSFVIAASSFFLVFTKLSDIRDALIMDMADVRGQHYKDIATGKESGSNYLMLIPNILTSAPFPTVALFLWFYIKAFTKSPLLLRAGLLMASIVQAILSIVMAGRAAMIYWGFDFFLLYSYFYRVLPSRTKKAIILTASVLGALAGFLFITITVTRFDGGNTDPFESLYGYAGQHVNNFCTMFTRATDSPFTIDRIFPLTSKILGTQYDMVEHYETITSHLKEHSVLVNVFDTFGGEVYLDLGWIGYILFFAFLALCINWVRYNWEEMTLPRTFLLVIVIAFFTRGLFAWPFASHYSTMAIALLLFNCYFFKYTFKV